VFRKILVGLDGSEGSWKALRAAIALSQIEPGCELWALSVEERLPRMPEVIDELSEEKARQNAIFESVQKQARQLTGEAGVDLRMRIIVGHAAQATVRFAEAGQFDCIVVGHSGRSGVWGTFLGSTADKIVRHATCSVLVVR